MLSLHGANLFHAKIKIEHQIDNGCSGVQINHIEVCLSNLPCYPVSADDYFNLHRFLRGVPDELHIAAILLYPESGVIGAPYYRIQINRTIPIARAA